jgi:acetyl-CoA carboxylase carboxyl transferase subunit alpha
MANAGLEFERSLTELERKIIELREFAAREGIDVSAEVDKLEKKAEILRQDIYSRLSAWSVVQIMRHPQRPHALDYVSGMLQDFMEVHGDRQFADDKAMVCGFARLEGRALGVVGIQKGRDTKENLLRNFGMAQPEGYRKALRFMRLCEKFHLPILTLVDTSGAYPGMEGEERSVAEAIARNLFEMSHLRVPIVVAVIGEGGSGGAIGIAVGDRLLMLENAFYSVISPEGCAAILWKDRAKAERAAEALKATAKDLLALGVVDAIVPEPLGGAHRDAQAADRNLGQAVGAAFAELERLPMERLLEERYQKFRAMGRYAQPGAGPAVA